jgi:hypothetical protein
MTSPATAVPSKRALCTTSGCERPALVSAAVCRAHLVDILRAEGEVIPWEEGDFAGLAAAAIHIVRVAFEGVPEETLRQPTTQMDMYALLPMDAEWAIAQASLDMLGTRSDVLPTVAARSGLLVIDEAPADVAHADEVAPGGEHESPSQRDLIDRVWNRESWVTDPRMGFRMNGSSAVAGPGSPTGRHRPHIRSTTCHGLSSPGSLWGGAARGPPSSTDPT